MPKTKNEKRLTALEKMKHSRHGAYDIATELIARLPFRQLKDVCESLGITDEDIKDL